MATPVYFQGPRWVRVFIFKDPMGTVVVFLSFKGVFPRVKWQVQN